MKLFTVGINQKIVGKCDPQLLSYSNAWRAATLTLSGLAAHIGNGYPWMPALLDKGHRRLQHFANHAEVLALDIDEVLTIEQALDHPFVKAHCGLGIESASSTDDHNKFRLVFRLATPVEEWRNVRACNVYLAHLVGNADRACKDPSRYFFGAPGRKAFLLNEEVTLPPSFEADAIAWHQAIEAEEARRAEEARQQWEAYKVANPGTDTDELIRSALSAIDPDCHYNTWIAIGMALAGLGDQWLYEWDSWSSGGSSYQPGVCDRKWKSFRGKRPAPEVIFGIAKGYGWRYPKKTWLNQIADRLQRKNTPQQSAKALKQKLQDEPFAGHEYEPGNRLAAWKRAISEGYRHVLDKTGTGGGKTHDTGLMQPDDFDARQLIYFSQFHYSPSTETLAPWVDLHGRHNGLTLEQTAGGQRLRRAKRGEERAVPANCSRNSIISALRAKNISGADSASVICQTCPLADACKHGEGSGFGYLSQRRQALIAPRIRMHPDSAPGADYDFSNVIAVWDEPGESFAVSEDIKVTEADVIAVSGHLALYAPELLGKLQPFLSALKELYSRKQEGFGLSHKIILETLQKLPDVLDLHTLAEALKPNLEFLDPVVDAESGLRVSDLPGRSQKLKAGDLSRFGDKETRVNLRSHFSEDAEAQREKAESSVLKQWLPDLLRILKGDLPGGLRLSFDTLTLTKPSYRHRETAKATKANIFLDATLTREDLALRLGCRPEDIFVCRQRQVRATNLTITQIEDLGRVSARRGQDQEKRIAALISHYRELDPGTKVIDLKKFGADGAWWRDSRGVNDFIATSTLILVGTPCRNLSALQSEYACLTGRFPTEKDQEFGVWCDRIIKGDMLQGIGRLRANRRSGENLQVVLISNFDLGLPVNRVKASDVTLQAAGKAERAKIAIKAAVDQLRGAGKKITQAAIAKGARLSQGYVSRFRELLQTLLGDQNSKSNNSPGSPDSEVLGFVRTALALASDSKEMRETVADLLDLVGPADFFTAIFHDPPLQDSRDRRISAWQRPLSINKQS